MAKRSQLPTWHGRVSQLPVVLLVVVTTSCVKLFGLGRSRWHVTSCGESPTATAVPTGGVSGRESLAMLASDARRLIGCGEPMAEVTEIGEFRLPRCSDGRLWRSPSVGRGENVRIAGSITTGGEVPKVLRPLPQPPPLLT